MHPAPEVRRFGCRECGIAIQAAQLCRGGLAEGGNVATTPRKPPKPGE